MDRLIYINKKGDRVVLLKSDMGRYEWTSEEVQEALCELNAIRLELDCQTGEETEETQDADPKAYMAAAEGIRQDAVADAEDAYVTAAAAAGEVRKAAMAAAVDCIHCRLDYLDAMSAATETYVNAIEAAQEVRRTTIEAAYAAYDAYYDAYGPAKERYADPKA